jgi:two-component system LytT family response regulator
MTVRTLIVDDEPLARDCVRLALAGEDVTVVGECGDGDGAVAAIRRLAPDLVFLDVQMPGLDGFDVVARVGPARMPPVVFVTAYDEHALRAFQVHALDYVLKPFDDERLRQALAHARRFVDLDGATLARRLAALLAEHPGEPGAPRHFVTRFTVKRDDRIQFVPAAEVDWFEAAGNRVVLHVGEHTFAIRATLRSVLEGLDPASFARIHRSTIVNVDRIREVQPWFGGDYVAILRDGRKLRVSRNYRDDLLRPTR